MTETKRCIQCGAVLPEDAAFCPHCTATQVTRQVQAVPRRRSRRRLALLGVGTLAALTVGGWALWGQEKPAAQEAPAAEPSPYSPEVQAVIQEGRTALKEMGRLYASIPNPEIRSRINELMSVSDKIIRDAIDDPADVPQIRKFLDFYLPTTIRLLNAYDRMSAQEFGGENITGSMQRIEEMLDTTIAAYKKQLDALFANQAADIQMDIDTMNTMLAREGLGGKGYLDIKDFMKQYEQQQSAAEAAPAPASDTSSEQTMKGSTSHG